MQINIPSESEIQEIINICVEQYWEVRETGVLNGRTMFAFENAIKTLLIQNGVDDNHIVNGTKATLPGYFRASKNWDIVVYKPLSNGKNLLLAAIEMKSMYGSVGNNLNNRSEEAIGSAFDLQKANTRLRLSSKGENFERPFIGYIFLLGEHEKNKKGSKIGIPLFGADEVFVRKDPQGNLIPENYETRTEVLVNRLVESELYTSGTFILANNTTVKGYQEPNPELGFYQFIAKLLGEVISRYHVAR